MNALARAATSNIPRVTGTRFYSQKVVDSIRNKPVWLGDISTYPTIAVCGAGCVGALGYMSYLFFFHPDVRVDKNKRGSVLRWWGVKA